MNQEGALSWKSIEESFQEVTDGCIVEGIVHHIAKYLLRALMKNLFLVLCNKNSCIPEGMICAYLVNPVTDFISFFVYFL